LRADRNAPNPPRNVIYLLPVGAFSASAPPLAQLAGIVHAFFMLDVKTLPAVNVGDVTATTRINVGTNKRQLFAPDVLGWHRKGAEVERVGILTLGMRNQAIGACQGWRRVRSL